MENEVIVIISEGENTENLIIDNIKKNFAKFSRRREIVFLPFKTCIYELWEVMKKDNFETEILDVLMERDSLIKSKIEEVGKESIYQIFLFFDYDGHACRGKHGDQIIRNLLETFDNETMQGKLYISYPMVEALKDLKKNDNCCRSCFVPIINNISYKQIVSENTEFQDLTKLKKIDWYHMMHYNLKKANCIVFSSFNTPQYNDYFRYINQSTIFEGQKTRFIRNAKIAVISGFTLFLLDFYGQSLYDTIQIWKDNDRYILEDKCCDKF